MPLALAVRCKNGRVSTAVVRAGGSAFSPERSPGYWRLFRSATLAQVAGGFVLYFVGSLTLWLTGLVGLSSNSALAIYAPWVVDGPWALFASVGWGILVSVLIGSLLRERVIRRCGVVPSRTLTLASVAIGGYAPWLFTASSGGRAFLSLFLVPGVLRVVAFDSSRGPRQLPHGLELSRRQLAVGLALSMFALVLPYSLLHPFSVHGTGSSGDSTAGNGSIDTVAPGRAIWLGVGLQSGDLPLSVTSVRLFHGADVEISDVTISQFFDPETGVPRAPVHVGARGQLWIGYKITLVHCPNPTMPVGVERVRIDYSQLGLPLEQTVTLAGNGTLLACST